MGPKRIAFGTHVPPSPTSAVASLLTEAGVTVQRIPDPGQDEATDATLHLHLPAGVSLVAEVFPDAGELPSLLGELVRARCLVLIPRDAADEEPVAVLAWNTLVELLTYARAGLAAQEVLAVEDEDAAVALADDLLSPVE